MLVRAFRFVNPNLLDERRQDLAGFAEKRMIGEGSERRWILVDLDHDRAVIFRAPPQIGRWINHARSPDRKENVAQLGRVRSGSKRIDWQHFAEPNDVWP